LQVAQAVARVLVAFQVQEVQVVTELRLELLEEELVQNLLSRFQHPLTTQLLWEQVERLVLHPLHLLPTQVQTVAIQSLAQSLLLVAVAEAV
jgi:hypothetical protein